jgi:hypothetical protein
MPKPAARASASHLAGNAQTVEVVVEPKSPARRGPLPVTNLTLPLRSFKVRRRIPLCRF